MVDVAIEVDSQAVGEKSKPRKQAYAKGENKKGICFS
jgi:hypothetical protein